MGCVLFLACSERVALQGNGTESRNGIRVRKRGTVPRGCINANRAVPREHAGMDGIG